MNEWHSVEFAPQGWQCPICKRVYSRHKHKNGVEDLKKDQVYLGWLIESEEEQK